MKRRGLIIGGGVVAVASGLGLGFRALRGPVGAIQAGAAVPEFTSLEPARWQNGAPTSLVKSKGEVVFVEGWSPG